MRSSPILTTAVLIVLTACGTGPKATGDATGDLAKSEVEGTDVRSQDCGSEAGTDYPDLIIPFDGYDLPSDGAMHDDSPHPELPADMHWDQAGDVSFEVMVDIPLQDQVQDAPETPNDTGVDAQTEGGSVDVCQTDCEGKECGADGCQGSCGTCLGIQDECVEGTCMCQPDCDGKACGSDGCEGSCGSCDDANVCNGQEECKDGACLKAMPLDCNDGNPCTSDTCNVETGCHSVSKEDNPEPLCHDGNPCTQDFCISGNCANTLKPLDELVVEDCLCDSDEDCQLLNDENLCNGVLVCDTLAEEPTCQIAGDSVVSCALPEDAHPECNEPTCIPSDGSCTIAFINDGQPCNDGNSCTQGEKCGQGECKGGEPVSCDDGNQCTIDSCDETSGKCNHMFQELPCDDEDPCTINDVCAEGNCTGESVVCPEDGNLCTLDSCDPTSGDCVGLPVDDGELCGDGDICNGIEKCVAGTCQSGESLVCPEPENPCLAASCDAGLGCISEEVLAVPCDDGEISVGSKDPPQVRIRESCLPTVSQAEYGFRKVRLAKIGPMQICALQIGSHEICSTQLCSSKVCLEQLASREVATLKIRPNQEGLIQVDPLILRVVRSVAPSNDCQGRLHINRETVDSGLVFGIGILHVLLTRRPKGALDPDEGS